MVIRGYSRECNYYFLIRSNGHLDYYLTSICTHGYGNLARNKFLSSVNSKLKTKHLIISVRMGHRVLVTLFLSKGAHYSTNHLRLVLKGKRYIDIENIFNKYDKRGDICLTKNG